ncbi:MAG: T9SS type A sorting domain-containing protein [Bacteroidota bacterium]
MRLKYQLFFIFYTFSLLQANAQINFIKSYGGNDTEYGYDVAINPQGGYFICGETLTPAFTFWSCENYLISTDLNGTLSTSFSTGGNTGCDYQTCMRALPDSGYIIAGNTLSYGLAENDFQIIRFNKYNSIVWSKRLGGIDSDNAYGIALTHDGGFAIAGFYSIGCCNAQFYVAKLDANGNLVWTCIFGGAGFERLNSIERTTDNGFIVCGQGGGPPAPVIAKISVNGALQWQTILQGSTTDQPNHAIQTSDGNYAVAGYSYSYSSGSADIMLCKLDSAGGLMWYNTFGNSVYNDAVDLTETPDSGIVIAGNSWNGFSVNDNVVVMKTDKNGNLIYAHEYGKSTWLEDARAMDVAPDEGFVITGQTFGCPSTNYEVLLLKTLPDGTCPTCDSNTISFSTTIGTPTVIVGNTISTTGGTVNTIAPLFQYDASNMTLCSGLPTALPIELVSFYGKATGTQNLLNWTTTSELNNNYFSLQRSRNGNNFETIATINGAGNSTQTATYTFTDTKPFIGINYYQLNQTDYNGETTNSKIIALQNPTDKYIQLIISPNPANNFINVFYQGANEKDEVKIIDIFGETIINTNNKSNIDISALPNGIYFVNAITINGYAYNQKLIIEK